MNFRSALDSCPVAPPLVAFVPFDWLELELSLAPLSSFFFASSALVLVEAVALVVSELGDSDEEGEAVFSCAEALMLNAAVAATAMAAKIKCEDFFIILSVGFQLLPEPRTLPVRIVRRAWTCA